MDMMELDGQVVEGWRDGGMLEDGEGRRNLEDVARRDMARTLKELKARHPDRDTEQLIEMANYQVLVQQQKSRAFYRIQATRMMIGAGNILKKHAADQARKVVSSQEPQLQEDDPHTTRMEFQPSHYQCFENCGSLKLTVARHGGDPGASVKSVISEQDLQPRAAPSTACPRLEPRHRAQHPSHPPGASLEGGGRGDSNENKPTDDEVAKMGCPSLGENTRIEVVIEESYEFKNTVDKLIKKTNLALVVGSCSWREQFVSAVTVSAGDDDDEESGEERLPSCFDYIMHFLTVFWKVLFAFVPPTEYWNGWACFIVSISLIGVLTAVTGDLASAFGCTVGLKDSVTAVVFVALGTSVPDTFASKVAAIQDQYADASIGNVTGSNAVNVFLGIGVAWTIAAVFWRSKGQVFRVDPGSLAFSVTLFTVMACICVMILLYRRRASVAGGELGGPRTTKIITSLVFLFMWLIYILLSSLEAYCHMPGF
nr:sodium/calcium exchanger 1-like [Salvelinus alpinus]